MVGSRPCSCECEPGRDPCRINHCSLHLPPFLSLPSLFLRIDRSCSLPDHSDNCSAYHSLFQPLRIILLPDRGAEDEQYQKTCKHAGSGSAIFFWRTFAVNPKTLSRSAANASGSLAAVFVSKKKLTLFHVVEPRILDIVSLTDWLTKSSKLTALMI